MPSESTKPVEVFYSYSHKDEKLRDELDDHLSLLQRQGFIAEWHDRRIEPGGDWANEISEHLDRAQIILLLVSASFIASDYCYGIEMERALERHEQGEAIVIPVILRPVDWESSPFGKLQALPKNAKPVVKWGKKDDAFVNVAQGIREIIKKFQPKQKSASAPIPRRPEFGFVARRDEEDGRDIVERLKEELAPGQNRLVTLSGPGGIGKTTLASEAARALQPSYGGRVVWSSADSRPDYKLPTLLDDIATQLGRPQLRTLAPEAKAEQVLALVSDPPALVVLDNCETIAPAEQGAIEAWFAQAQCSALFTSRAAVGGTSLISVSAMSREEAAEFLEKLVRQTRDRKMFTPDVRRRVYETAEANPFVMQWVTAQIDLAQEPDDVLEELKSGKGDAAQRVFDRSFKLPQLGDDGRDALLALSLFTPSAPREALAEVAGLDERRLNEAVKNLRALWLIKGLDANRRLAAEGLTRTLVEARLSKDSRAADFRRRFAAYFLHYAEGHKEWTPENHDSLEAEKDNLLKAAEVAFASKDFHIGMLMADSLANPVDGMLSVRGYWDETVGLGEQALQAARFSQDEIIVATFSHNLGVMYAYRGELTKARQLYEESLEIVKRLGNEHGVASTLHQLAVLEQNQGRPEEARRLYNESLEIKKRLGNQRGVASALHELGRLAQSQGRPEEARRLYNESLEISKRLGDQNIVASTLHELAVLTQGQGQWEEARRLYDESLEISKKLGNQHGVALTLGQLGYLAEDNGDKVEAARLFREALGIFERLGSPYAELARRNLKRIEGRMTEDEG